MKFTDIPQLTKAPSYKVNVGWRYLKEHINRDRRPSFNMNPDFQRGRVWTKKQKIAYVEFKLRGGSGSDIIQTNCPGWMNDFRGPYVLVDGKQRLNAVLDFLDDKIKVFNHYYYSEFEDNIHHSCDFLWCVNDLKTRKEVLIWYLELNTGGTPHTKAEIEKVKKLLEQEK